MFCASQSASGHRLPLTWLGGLALSLALSAPLGAQPTSPAPASAEAPSAPLLNAAQMRALEQATQAVVGLQAKAVEGARSASTLGAQREGSGVVIEDDLVLTIGYLILEAENVMLLPDDGRRVPARVVAYDLATGFGLVRSLVPLKVAPARMAATAAVSTPQGANLGAPAAEPLAVASGGDSGQISLARLLSRRPFSGYWEYHIEGALFTAPARRDHSGAGLFNASGELLGVGSLFVNDGATSGVPGQPANMFVPVELLRPILQELRERGSSQASQRAWLGLSCVERDDGVLVLRVNDDSPAEVAGLAAGDRIMAIDGTAVTGLGMLWKTLWAGGRPERAVKLDIRRKGELQTVTVNAVDRAKTLRRPDGI